MNQSTQKKGFTIIEIIIFLFVLSLICLVGYPKYIHLSTKVKTATLKGHLGLMRVTLATKYAERALNGITPLYPPTITSDFFTDYELPIEPFANTTNILVITKEITTKNITNQGGWIYSNTSGRIIANYSDSRGRL